MIGFLKGKIALKDGQFIYLDVNNVGYKILVSNDILSKSQVGSEYLIFTYTHIREDAMELFGFLNFEDLKLFEMLIGVSGVGPKTAVNIFSQAATNQIIQAIRSGDVDFFTAVPRLGRKNAQKIIIELKNKLGENQDIDINAWDNDLNKEVISALKNFGFSVPEIQKALKSVNNKDASVEEKIKLAFKFLGK